MQKYVKCAKKLRKVSSYLQDIEDKMAIVKYIDDRYDIKIDPVVDINKLMVFKQSLEGLPPQLVKDCGVKFIGFEDLGPSKRYYPNHGKYKDDRFILNTNIFEDPFLEVDFKTGQAVNKLDQTLYHELGHGWDEQKGDDLELSRKPEWMSLSDWTEERKPGYKRLIIREKGCPELRGDLYYSPDAEFVRFYAKRNPWDDWADTFSYYVAGLPSFIPDNKKRYFDERLRGYYES